MNEQPAEANKLVEPEPCESVEREPEPELRRSTRQTTQPDRYDIWVDTVAAEPATVQEALTGPEKEEWSNAMKQKMESIIYSNDVWDQVVATRKTTYWWQVGFQKKTRRWIYGLF